MWVCGRTSRVGCNRRQLYLSSSQPPSVPISLHTPIAQSHPPPPVSQSHPPPPVSLSLHQSLSAFTTNISVILHHQSPLTSISSYQPSPPISQSHPPPPSPLSLHQSLSPSTISSSYSFLHLHQSLTASTTSSSQPPSPVPLSLHHQSLSMYLGKEEYI
ncbi:hypothetical protein Pcinc_027403 [Petrolisthes cinctipes]|uniref:Uncharacterized protein n=1 Tax=Petrolisthes cinctipes TaxID=88211 RepID=A0AAE1F3Z6_PETCI|nr:hypothetical protein Pcinc_027403 [Petrolisthes cinctipes]